MNNKIIVGLLVITILASSAVYITLSGQGIKMRVDNDQTTFYVLNENSRWIVSGREYNKLFDGTSQMNRDTSGVYVNTTISGMDVWINRYTPYIRGPVIIDTYHYKGDIADKTLFPISHKIEVINGSGFFYRYEVRDLDYSGDTYKLNGETVLLFGNNMKVELNPNYRWAWVYKIGIVRAQYDINSDYEIFYARLFDPPNITIYSPLNISYNTTPIWFNWSYDTFDTAIFSLNGDANVTISSTGEQNALNDSSTIKNLTYSSASTKYVYADLPKDITITSAKMVTEGYKSSAITEVNIPFNVNEESGTPVGVGQQIIPTQNGYLSSIIFDFKIPSGCSYTIENITMAIVGDTGSNLPNEGDVKHAWQNVTIEGYGGACNQWDYDITVTFDESYHVTTGTKFWVVWNFTYMSLYGGEKPIRSVNDGATYSGTSAVKTAAGSWSSGLNDYSLRLKMKQYPSDVNIDTAMDGHVDNLTSGEQTYSQTVNLNTTAINDFIGSCSDPVTCTVPISINSSTTGILELKNINLSYSYTGGFNRTLSADYGQNNLSFWVNDSLGDVNTTIVYFFLNTATPIVTLSSPENSSYNDSVVDINVTVNQQADLCWYNLDSGTNISLTNSTVTNWFTQTNSSLVLFHTYHLIVYCNDTFSSIGYDDVWFSYGDINITNYYPTNTTDYVLDFDSGDLSFDYINQTVTWWNATPENQTTTYGIDNITITEYSGISFNFTISVYLNQSTPACGNGYMNIWIVNDSADLYNENVGINLTTSPQVIYESTAVNTSRQFWEWVDIVNATLPCAYDHKLLIDVDEYSESLSTSSFIEGWESGITSNWSVYGTGTNFTTANDTDAHTGTYSLIMQSSVASSNALNEIKTTVNFSGSTYVNLDFYGREWTDEDNAASDHTDHENADGVYFTCDGSYWYALDTLALTASWVEHSYVVSDDPDFCGTTNSSFAIKFSQYDNYPLTSDGIGIDDINITYGVS